MRAILVVLALCLPLSGAEAKRPSRALASVEFLAAVQSVTAEDLDYARALAQASATPASQMRANCYLAWTDVLHRSTGASAGIAGASLAGARSPISRFERSSQAGEAIHASGPLQAACAPVARAVGLSVDQFIVRVARARR